MLLRIAGTDPSGRDCGDHTNVHVGAFLLCTLWLADALALTDRTEKAIRVFERLVALRNDVGLLAEDFDVD